MTKQATVATMVNHRIRIAPTRRLRKIRTTTPGSAVPPGFGLAKRTTPSRGANSTATNQDTISAMVTTAKIENVYSPAVLRAKPIGTKPAAVTNDPVSIGNATVLYAKDAAFSVLSPW